MRTPGNDVELSVGFLFTEGIVPNREAVLEVSHCTRGGPQALNVVEVRLAPGVAVDPTLFERNFYVSSSCGVCGKASLDAVCARGVSPLASGGFQMSAESIASLPDRLRAAQAVFDHTGGLHAAGLFDASGALVRVFEDVGRHNAVDKVIGHALLTSALPKGGGVLVVSGRSSFEIVQKAVSARIPCIVSVGAPSSLAVETARRFNLTLVGFAREGSFNVYAGEERIG